MKITGFETFLVPPWLFPHVGIETDEAAVRHAAGSGHRWRNRIWRRPDGSLAEW